MLDISNTDFANRGYQSMALDSVTGDLYYGWYDGRNDPTYASVEYFGAVIPAKQLDKMVNRIPLSNPLYISPSATAPFRSTMMQAANKKANARKNFNHRKLRRYREKKPQIETIPASGLNSEKGNNMSGGNPENGTVSVNETNSKTVIST